jgi:hypothetical protein
LWVFWLLALAFGQLLRHLITNGYIHYRSWLHAGNPGGFMAHFLRALILFFILLHNQAHAIGEPGSVDLAGWSKGADGTYTKAFGGSTVSLTSAPKGITTTSTALVPTSKGTFEFPISKTANVDTARLGGKVASFAKRVGPLGMALTAADLVCSLSTICNDAGQWMIKGSSLPGDPISLTIGGSWWTSAGGASFTSSGAAGSQQCLNNIAGGGGQLEVITRTSNQYLFDVYCYRPIDNLHNVYGGAISTNAAVPATQSHAPTSSEWTTATTKLNDDRFTPHLLEDGQEDLPVSGLPTLPAGQFKNIGQQSQPVRDSSGNVTGRDDSVTKIEPVDAATAEAPGRVIIKETTTTTRYDNSNTVINTSTSTNYTAQPLESKPQNYEIKYDQVAPAELSTYQIPNTFNNTSWGSGTCPPDITVVTSIKTFAIPSQPICTAADMLKPFVLLLSTITGIFIISGVRSSEPA